MSIEWFIRIWLVVIAVCVVMTLSIVLGGCASIQTSDCVKNDKGVWTCNERSPRCLK